MSIITAKGQATIPKAVIECLGIIPGGTHVDFMRSKTEHHGFARG
jgi:bifunctional DNA-binding transcriptional regulator/antitoxin component of YhaV-PrlF toxin-antitoxin module